MGQDKPQRSWYRLTDPTLRLQPGANDWGPFKQLKWVYECDKHYRQRHDSVENPTRMPWGAKCHRFGCRRLGDIVIAEWREIPDGD
jgi:hypothetical protein